ncbi:MAG: hypothetical protein HY273_16220 [Gammaproteobacteria bacterium]|nr:hypothetical protein [Gammaproteobacteria bacterium]
MSIAARISRSNFATAFIAPTAACSSIYFTTASPLQGEERSAYAIISAPIRLFVGWVDKPSGGERWVTLR